MISVNGALTGNRPMVTADARGNSPANTSASSISDQAFQSREISAVQTLSEQLHQRAKDNPQALKAALEQAYGDKVDGAALDKMVSMATNGNLPLPKNVRFVDAGLLGPTSLGAYDQVNGGTIYLDRRLLNDPKGLESIFSEELGHHIDAKLGGSDASGDEGAIFSKAFLDGPIGAVELTALKSENDNGFIQIDGKRVAVEFNGYGGTGSSSASGGTDSSSSAGSSGSSRSGNSSGYGGTGSSSASGGTDTPSNAYDNTADGPNGGNPADAVGFTDAGSSPNARDPNGRANNGEHNNTADGLLGGDPSAFEKLTGNPSEWSQPDTSTQSSFSTMAGMFWDWATGTGPANRVFKNDPVSRSLQDAPVMNEARDFWYDKVINGSENTSGYSGPGSSEATGGTDSISVESGVTNFQGTRRLGGGNFGPVGAWNAGLDPVEQVVGSYGVEIESDGETLTYTATNNTSMQSFAYGLGPEYERDTFGPGANLRQTYEFSEPIDVSRLDNGTSALNNTPDGPNGGDPDEFETMTDTSSNWSAAERGFLSNLWNRLTN